MNRPKDITYCCGRHNTLWEVQCVQCERYLELHDFKRQIISMADLSPKDESKCEYFMERE